MGAIMALDKVEHQTAIIRQPAPPVSPRRRSVTHVPERTHRPFDVSSLKKYEQSDRAQKARSSSAKRRKGLFHTLWTRIRIKFAPLALSDDSSLEIDEFATLVRNTPDANTTYASPPPFWPALERRSGFDWPYLITERARDELTIAPFNQTFLMKLSLLRNFPLKGRLMLSPSGYLYLKLPNQLLRLVQQFLPSDSRSSLFYYPDDFLGAHIPIALPSELERFVDAKRALEIGEEFYFSLEGLFSTEPHGWDEMERVWFLRVDCPQLEALRQRYGLTPRISTHSFSCTVALKKKELSAASSADDASFFRISPAVQPA